MLIHTGDKTYDGALNANTTGDKSYDGALNAYTYWC